MVTPKSRASCGSRVISGQERSFSHLLTAGGEFFLGHILFAAQLRDAAAESLIHHNNVTSKCCVMFGVGAPFHD